MEGCMFPAQEPPLQTKTNWSNLLIFYNHLFHKNVCWTFFSFFRQKQRKILKCPSSWRPPLHWVYTLYTFLGWHWLCYSRLGDCCTNNLRKRRQAPPWGLSGGYAMKVGPKATKTIIWTLLPRVNNFFFTKSSCCCWNHHGIWDPIRTRCAEDTMFQDTWCTLWNIVKHHF